MRGRDLVGFVEEAKAAVAAKVKLPAGYRMTWGGQFENQQRAAARLALVVPVALGLIFLLLFATFGSVRQAVLVFANIPFAMVGGIVALWISGEYLSRSRFGRVHRAAGHRRAQRRRDGDLLQPAARDRACRSTRWCARARSADCARC